MTAQTTNTAQTESNETTTMTPQTTPDATQSPVPTTTPVKNSETETMNITPPTPPESLASASATVTGSSPSGTSLTSTPTILSLPANRVSMPPLLSSTPKVPASIRLPDNIYYNQATSKFVLKMPTDDWRELPMSRLMSHLEQTYGLSTNPKGGMMSPAELAVYHIEQYRAVHFAGAVAGYREGLLQQGLTRVLVTSGPKFIAPVAGDWSLLRGILEKMFGDNQLPYFYGWLKVALEMFDKQTWMAGQVLVLCGPPGAGKNLLAFLIQKLFGGREPGKPYDYMTQKTTFNSDIIGAELLTIEDEVSHTKIEQRRDFGAKIKDVAVNKSRRLHKKYADGVTVVPLQRLVISLNDEPERVSILPPVDTDIADKLMIFKVEYHSMPMPTDTPADQELFGDALVAQLPAFLEFLTLWKIPNALVSPRCGVAHYHHPDILEMLNAMTPEDQLLRLVDEELFGDPMTCKTWHGKAVELERELLDAQNPHIERETRKLLRSINCCGRYLGRLADRYPKRVTRFPGSAGIHKWRIEPPEQGTAGMSLQQSWSPAIRAKLEKITGKSLSEEQCPSSDSAH